MSATRSNISFDTYKLKGLSRKCGFDRWRCVFSGYHSYTGDKAFFFIELFVINPALFPDSVQSSKPQPLEGSLDTSVLLSNQDDYPLSSYVALKVGVYGKNPKVFQVLYPAKDLIATKKEISIRDGAFISNLRTLTGNIRAKNGHVNWNINVERECSFYPKKLQKDMNWNISGLRTLLAGEISIQDECYIVSPGTSYGYIDKMWGKKYPLPFFHLSCSHLRSMISGKVLNSSAFSVQGMYKDSFAFYTELNTGSQVIKLSNSRAPKNYRFSCVPVEDTLHWSISLTYRGYLLDIDVFSKTNNMFVRSYSSPSTPADELQILGGASGNGELRLYKRVGKNIEMIEQVKLEDVCCEYGGIEHISN